LAYNSGRNAKVPNIAIPRGPIRSAALAFFEILESNPSAFPAASRRNVGIDIEFER
jgi:hypothetical protein